MFAKGLYLQLEDLGSMIRSLKREPIIINDIVRGIPTAETVEILNEITRVHYNDDSLDIMPTCGCGQLAGKFNEGLVCQNPDCSDPVVKRVLDQDYESLVWFSNSIPDAKFINPLLLLYFDELYLFSKTTLFFDQLTKKSPVFSQGSSSFYFNL